MKPQAGAAAPDAARGGARQALAVSLRALSPRRLLAAIGRPLLLLLRRLALAAGLGAAVMAAAVQTTTWRRPVRREFIRAMLETGVHGVRATVVIGALIGLAMVYQALYWLQAAGQTDLLGRVLVLVLVREIAPLLAGLIIVGRSGLPMLIYLDELRAGGELRMLEAQGIDPFLLLVVPRILAFAISCFCLGMLLLATALLVGYFIGHAVGAVQISLYAFLDTVLRAMGPGTYLLLPIKTLAIGFAVGVTCALPVLAATGESRVGELTAGGFVQACLAVFIVGGAVSVML